MLIFYTMILVYVVFPATLGAIANRALINGYSSISPLKYLAIKIIDGADYERLSYFTLLLIYLLVVSSGYGYFAKGEVLTWFRVGYAILLVLIFLSAIVNSARVYKAPILYQKYRFLFVPAAAGCVATMVTLSAIWADGFISVSAGVSGYDLPVGLAWLGLLLSPVSWAFAITIILLPWYAYVVFGVVQSKHKKENPAELCKTHFAESSASQVQEVPLYARISCALGMAIAALAPLQLMTTVLSFPVAERFFNDSLVFANFHHQPSICGLDIKGGKVALLPDDKALIAISDIEKGYVFKPVICHRKWLNNDELFVE